MVCHGGALLAMEGNRVRRNVPVSKLLLIRANGEKLHHVPAALQGLQAAVANMIGDMIRGNTTI